MKRYKPTFKQIVKEADFKESRLIPNSDKNTFANTNFAKELDKLKVGSLVWIQDRKSDYQGYYVVEIKNNTKRFKSIGTLPQGYSDAELEKAPILKESCKKKPKKKGMKEATVMFNDKESASDAIADIVEYLGHKISVFNPKFFDAIAWGVVSGVESLFEPSYSRSQIEIDDTDAVNEQNIKKVIFKIINSIKAKV